MGITKNKQSKETIEQMAAAAFPNKQLKSVCELTEGMCNAAYLVEFSDGSRSVLKIASKDRTGLLQNEVNLMAAEVKAMRIVHESNLVRVAEVQYYDTSHQICDGDYFFMEALEGKSYLSIEDSFSEEEKKELNYQIGQIERNITSIKGEKFGLLGDEENQYDSLFDFIYKLISNVLEDAEKKQIDTVVTSEVIKEKLLQDREIFDEVTQPVLIHWDMWEANVFVKDKQIEGVIDWERAMWGEAFMDARFRRHLINQDFLRGYGKENLTKAEMRRIYWYDIYLYLIIMTEWLYREYESDEQYWRNRPLYEASWAALVGEIKDKPAMKEAYEMGKNV